MSMPPPNRSLSKKRKQDDEEHQGGNDEKKGRSIQALALPEPKVPTLTRWRYGVRPMSDKMKAFRITNNAITAGDKRRGNSRRYIVGNTMEDLAEELDGVLPTAPTNDPVSAWEAARDITSTMAELQGYRYRESEEYKQLQASCFEAQALPNDVGWNFGWDFINLRTGLRRYIAGLIRHQQHQFSQDHLPQLAQTRANWEVRGLCAGICIEYIQWRRIKASPDKIIQLLKADATQSRLGWTQKNHIDEHKKYMAIYNSHVPILPKDSLFSSSLDSDVLKKAGILHDMPFNALHGRLLQAHNYPRSIARKRLDFAGAIAEFDFSLETLEALLPPGRQTIPAMARYAVARSHPASLINASSSSSSSSTSIPAHSQFRLSAHDAADEQQSDSEVIRLIKRDFKKYQTDFERLRHLIVTNLEEPYVLIALKLVHEANLITGADSGRSGHAILLDTSRDHAGIFDPNIGFLPLGSGGGAAVNMHELYWLLGLLLVYYDVTALRFSVLK